MLKEKYVCVALDARKERGEYKDADGDFVRATKCVTVTASGSVCVVTAGGKALGPYGGPGAGMEKWLTARLKDWAALPEAERVGVKVPKSEVVDPKRAALAMPSGALIVRVFNRHLGWNKDKSLRYATAEDYVAKTGKAEAERYGMAQNDFMWIPEKEWRALRNRAKEWRYRCRRASRCGCSGTISIHAVASRKGQRSLAPRPTPVA